MPPQNVIIVTQVFNKCVCGGPLILYITLCSSNKIGVVFESSIIDHYSTTVIEFIIPYMVQSFR